MDKQLTVSVAADRLNVTPQRVRNLIAQGRIIASKPGQKNYRISEQELASFVKLPVGRPRKVKSA